MINLSGKTALVTGAARGIGKAIITEYAKAGCNICFTDITDNASQIIQEIKKYNVECLFFQGDVTDTSQCTEIINQIIEKVGNLDILVNNAGITKDTLLSRMNKEDWDDVINVNLTGVFNMTKAAIKPMVKARSGKIINVSSIVGYIGNPGQTNYSSTKAGLIGFTKSLARELASRNITCNAIAPGFIQTDMTDKLSDEQKNNLTQHIPLKKLGSALDIANGALFLASSLSDYITGTTLHINGGMY